MVGFFIIWGREAGSERRVGCGFAAVRGFASQGRLVLVVKPTGGLGMLQTY